MIFRQEQLVHVFLVRMVQNFGVALVLCVQSNHQVVLQEVWKCIQCGVENLVISCSHSQRNIYIIYADVVEVGGGGVNKILFCFSNKRFFLFQEEVAQIALSDLYEHLCLAMIFPVLTAKTDYSC